MMNRLETLIVKKLKNLNDKNLLPACFLFSAQNDRIRNFANTAVTLLAGPFETKMRELSLKRQDASGNQAAEQTAGEDTARAIKQEIELLRNLCAFYKALAFSALAELKTKDELRRLKLRKKMAL